jgi:hypothetical protein
MKGPPIDPQAMMGQVQEMLKKIGEGGASGLGAGPGEVDPTAIMSQVQAMLQQHHEPAPSRDGASGPGQGQGQGPVDMQALMAQVQNMMANGGGALPYAYAFGKPLTPEEFAAKRDGAPVISAEDLMRRRSPSEGAAAVAVDPKASLRMRLQALKQKRTGSRGPQEQAQAQGPQ